MSDVVPRLVQRRTYVGMSWALRTPKEIPDDVSGDLGVFAKAAERVREPRFSERDVDSQGMAGGDEFSTQSFGHAEKHLKFVPLSGNSLALDELLRKLHEGWIVGGDPDAAGASQKKSFEE